MLDGDNELEQLAADTGNADGNDTADDDTETLDDVFVHLLDQEEAMIKHSTPPDDTNSAARSAAGNEMCNPHAFILSTYISADIYALTSKPFYLHRDAEDRFMELW